MLFKKFKFIILHKYYINKINKIIKIIKIVKIVKINKNESIKFHINFIINKQRRIYTGISIIK